MLQYLTSLFTIDGLLNLLYTIPCVLISLTFHEFAHGWVAMKLGDDTAHNFGRLTLNPIKHLEPIGTICMVLFGFGWAKPVPINARKFKNPRTGMALTAAAGPLMNFILAFISAFVTAFLFWLAPHLSISSGFGAGLFTSVITLFQIFHILNLSLGLFNLIPIPPLDGSRIVYIFLPAKWYFGIMKYERYIKIIFLLLLWTNIVRLPLSNAVSAISDLMFRLAFLVFRI